VLFALTITARKNPNSNTALERVIKFFDLEGLNDMITIGTISIAALLRAMIPPATSLTAEDVCFGGSPHL
jgi:hypothetical protein